MPHPSRPSANHNARRTAFILSLCVLSLAALRPAAGPAGLAFSESDRHHPAEITTLDTCVNDEFDSHSAAAGLPPTQPLDLIGPRPVAIQFLALGPALRPIVPPPETAQLACSF